MSRDAQRERAVRDWLVVRAAGSLGVDLVALRAGERPRLIEVKSTRGGPYERFGPADRERLRLAPRWAARPLGWCGGPPRGELHWVAEREPDSGPPTSATSAPASVATEDAT